MYEKTSILVLVSLPKYVGEAIADSDGVGTIYDSS